MSLFWRKKYLGGASFLAFASAFAANQAAFAQEEETTRGLDTIVVTAQFKEQNVQDAPIAITAISGDTLDVRGHNNVTDIAAQSPNVTLTSGSAFAGPSLIAFIRGVGQTDFNPALEPGVGLYVDDVYYSTLTGAVLDLLDLDRVEVLRGPQGTLSGKNSIGGSIKLFTKRPDEERDGYIEASVGTFDAVKVRAASNFTIVDDKLWARISGVTHSRDGYVKTLDYGCTHPGSGFPTNTIGENCRTGTDGGVQYSAVRGALRWAAADTVEVNLSGEYVRDTSDSTANTLLAVGPTLAPVIHPNGLIWETISIPPTLGSNVGCMFLAFGAGSCDPLSPNDPYVSYADYHDPRNGLTIPQERSVESTGVHLNIDWDLAEDLQLQSITGYREYDSSFSGDYDASPMPTALLFQTNTHRQWSQEVRLNGNVFDRVDWTVGGFYFDSFSTLTGRIDLGYVGFDFIHGPDPVETTNWALFGNVIISLTDRLEVAGGARYSEDEKNYTFRRSNPDGSPIQPCLGPPGTPGNPPNCLIASLDGINSVFSGDRVDYRAAVSYDLLGDVRVYASISTGYKGGGVNPRPFYDVQAATFQPEDMTTYEIGFKAQAFDNRLRVNAAGFYNDYKDFTATFNDCTAQFGPIFGVPCLLNSNAGDAKVKGAELELDFLVTDDFLFDASFSYIDFETKRVNPATGLTTDNVLPFTPEITWSVGAQYTYDLGFGTITPRVDVSYQDDVFTAPDNTVLGMIEAYTLVNGSLRFASADADWELILEGRNLTDKLYYMSKIDSLPGLGGTVYGTPALPRTLMVKLRHNF